MRIVFSLITVLVFSGCSSNSIVHKYTGEPTSVRDSEIYVVSHGWHTGFVVPSENVYQAIPKLKDRFGNTKQIEFGWGDKGFYQSKEITTGLTLRAIFWPTESVIHAVSVPSDVHEFFSNSTIVKICLNESELESLISFISESFKRSESGEIIPQNNGIYGNSQFYEGTGNYYLMNTCNKWTAKGLESSGLDISPTFKLTASSVMNYVSNRNNCPNIYMLPSVNQPNEINNRD